MTEFDVGMLALRIAAEEREKVRNTWRRGLGMLDPSYQAKLRAGSARAHERLRDEYGIVVVEGRYVQRRAA
jgi:hypothetical protein